jgi:hypothetical protein
MGREPPGRAALGGDDVDVLVPVVLAGEGDQDAVGREERRGLDPDVRGEPLRLAARAVDGP